MRINCINFNRNSLKHEWVAIRGRNRADFPVRFPIELEKPSQTRVPTELDQDIFSCPSSRSVYPENSNILSSNTMKGAFFAVAKKKFFHCKLIKSFFLNLQAIYRMFIKFRWSLKSRPTEKSREFWEFWSVGNRLELRVGFRLQPLDYTHTHSHSQSHRLYRKNSTFETWVSKCVNEWACMRWTY